MLAKIFPKASVCVYLKHRKEFIKTTGGRIHTNHSFNLDLKCFHAQINITFRFLLQFTRVFFLPYIYIQFIQGWCRLLNSL